MSSDFVPGTRVLYGATAHHFSKVTDVLKKFARQEGYNEFIAPTIASTRLFQSGSDLSSDLWCVADKGGQNITLVPEITPMAREFYLDYLSVAVKPVKMFYLARCYKRNERPQQGHYREFWQFGLEVFRDKDHDATRNDLICMLNSMLELSGLRSKNYTINREVERRADFYTEPGFEVESHCSTRGRKIAGGGRYDVGIGFAIHVDRLLIAIEEQNEEARYGARQVVPSGLPLASEDDAGRGRPAAQN